MKIDFSLTFRTFNKILKTIHVLFKNNQDLYNKIWNYLVKNQNNKNPNVENIFLDLGQHACFPINKHFILNGLKKKNKTYFISNFNNILLNDIIFDLESVELTVLGNSYDFFDNFYNTFFLVESTLFNYSIFQNRLLTNEINLFDKFFYDLPLKNEKQHELTLYQYFVFFYSQLYLPSEYNLQIIHSRDSMSFFTFFSLYYYDYFKIQQEHLQLFNHIYILDDLRGFNTILQLNNNLVTQNIENYMLNLQKLIYEESHIFYSTKVNYINYKYISLFYFTLLNFNQEKVINSTGLFEQSSLMFSRNYFNIFFKKLPQITKFYYSFFFFFVILIFLFFINFYEILFLGIICIFCFVGFILDRFTILFELSLFGYTKKANSKLFYEKLYLSDYKITQYDDIYYYQQKYILERDFENRKISNLLLEMENNSNFEEILQDVNPAQIFNNNVSELLFLTFYEILYDFECDAWKDLPVDTLKELELDRVEYYHGYPFELFISKSTKLNLTKELQAAANIDDFFDLKYELDSILERADEPEVFYDADLLSDFDLNNIEHSLNDLANFLDDSSSQDLELFELYGLSSQFFSFSQQRLMNHEADSDLVLNHDIPDIETESIEEEFISGENLTMSNAVNYFHSTQKIIQQKIFQVIYFELSDEKDFLIKYYKLDFLRTQKKLTNTEIIKLQKLLQEGSIPFWILNMNNFYKEVKYRVANWYKQLYATKKVYNDFALALLNLEKYYSGYHSFYYEETPNSWEMFLFVSLVDHIPIIGYFSKKHYNYRNEKYRRNFFSSNFAYTNIMDNDLLTSNFKDDQSLIDILETVPFSKILESNEDLPIQLDFFHHNIQVMTNMLNTLNSNLYLLFCNNINLNDFVLQNQISIFQHYLEYSIIKVDESKRLKNKIQILFDLFKFAKFNTLYDLDFFFYNYFLKLIKLDIVTPSPILVLNLVNYYINKYKFYSIKLPTNLNELNRFLLQLQQYEILAGTESFDSNTFIENSELSYKRFYNIVYNAFDKEFLEYEEMDAFFLEEFFFNEKYQTQFFYSQLIYFERMLYVDEDVLDGDITKLPPYLTYTEFNNITILSELNVPTLVQQKYLYADYMYTTLYTEISDDSLQFDGFFL